MNSGFDGKAAVVTGGASGIGRAVGEALGRAGASVFLVDLEGEDAEEVADGIRRADGQAEGEIASAVLFLLSDAASFVTGAVLPVDGGQSSSRDVVR